MVIITFQTYVRQCGVLRIPSNFFALCPVHLQPLGAYYGNCWDVLSILLTWCLQLRLCLLIYSNAGSVLISFIIHSVRLWLRCMQPAVTAAMILVSSVFLIVSCVLYDLTVLLTQYIRKTVHVYSLCGFHYEIPQVYSVDYNVKL